MSGGLGVNYELVPDEKRPDWFRMRALRMYSSASEGDLGALIPEPDKVSVEDEAWADKDSVLHPGTHLTGWASVASSVLRNTEMYDEAWVQQVRATGGKIRLSDYACVRGSDRGRVILTGNVTLTHNAEVRSSGYGLHMSDVTAGDYARIEAQGILNNAVLNKDAILYSSGVGLSFEDAPDIRLSDPRHVFMIGPVGSEGQTAVLIRTVAGPYVQIGCWSGMLDEMMPEVEKRRYGMHWKHLDQDRKGMLLQEYGEVFSVFEKRVREWEK